MRAQKLRKETIDNERDEHLNTI
jgi:hypothetical protein